MKNIYLLGVLIGTIFIQGCNEMDLYPQDQLGPSNFWKTEKDIQSGVAGVYSKLKGGSMDWNRYGLDNLTDNSYAWTLWSGYPSIQAGTIEPTTGGLISGNFSAGYVGVAACNNFLKNYDTAKLNAKLSEQKSKYYEAEVRFLRAFYYFDLVRFYGDIPLYKEAIESIESSKVKQSSASEVYDLIYSDLNFAIQYLPDESYFSGHAVKASARALKARVALFKHDWITVKEEALSIIENSKFRLSDDYQSIFIKREGQKNNPEILFSITYLNPDYRHSAEMVYYYQVEMAPLQNLIDCYDDKDLRLNEWYVKQDDGQRTFTNPFGEKATVEQPSLTGWLLLKHMDKYNKDTYKYTNYDFRTDNDVIVLRLADVYLMYIEAMLELSGGITNDLLALDCFNKIRNRAGISSVQNIERDELRLERRRELAFEGLRHYDLIRWQLAEVVMNNLVTPSGQCKFESRYYFWPFPQSEIDINPQLDQKAGY